MKHLTFLTLDYCNFLTFILKLKHQIITMEDPSDNNDYENDNEQYEQDEN
jgi:hypothetical protein